MASTATLRDNLKTAIAAVASLEHRTYDTWPGKINVPCALIKPVGRSWGSLTGAVQTQRFEVCVLVQLASMATAQDTLDAYYSDDGADSVEAAVLALPSVMDVSARDYGSIEVGDTEYLGFFLDVDILTG